MPNRTKPVQQLWKLKRDRIIAVRSRWLHCAHQGLLYFLYNVCTTKKSGLSLQPSRVKISPIRKNKKHVTCNLHTWTKDHPCASQQIDWPLYDKAIVQQRCYAKKKVLRKRRPMLAGMVMSCGSPNRNQHQPKPHPFWPTICKEAMLKCSTSQHALAIAPPQWLCPACEPPLLPALVVPPAAVGLEQCSWSSSTKPIAAPPRTKPRTRRQASNSALFPLP